MLDPVALHNGQWAVDQALVTRHFLALAGRGDADQLRWILAHRRSFTGIRDNVTGASMLHRAAAAGARAVVLLVATQSDCDFLVRDGRGRLPSELALRFGRDPVLARYLAMRERRQARDKGLELTRRPPP